MQTEYFVEVQPAGHDHWLFHAKSDSQEKALEYINQLKIEISHYLEDMRTTKSGDRSPARYRIRIVSTEIVEV